MTLIDAKEQIEKQIEEASSIFIMGHKYLDLDAIGSAIGIYEYLRTFDKKPTIIINDRKLEPGVKKIIDKMGDVYNIKKSKKIKLKINEKSLLIVVDTNKEALLQDSSLLDLFEQVIVIDHHDLRESSINKGMIVVDEEASSTCEMVAEYLDYNKTQINEDTATILLSGIVLDTNNYVLKTTTNTFRASYLLTQQGADPSYVQYLLKQDLKNYIARQKVITNVKIYKNIAISCAKSTLRYRREDLAKIADTLLLFNKIEASFVIGKLDKNTVGISARSIGNIDVGEILENLNGGGDNHEAGARIDDKSIKKVEEELREILKNK
ncbi:MAG: DHH family phosphoesterase [Bacilli bacterium]|nr:DHH family phosphoesterase [Bacilli bacterium]